MDSTFRRVGPSFALAVLLSVTLHGDRSWTKADADALERKLVLIATNGMAAEPQSRRTPVTEREVNAFLQSRVDLPEGVVEPLVTILPDGRLSGRATVDLDAVRASRPRGTLSPWNLMTGKVPVHVQGVLATSAGVGAFTLEETTVGGMPVPKTLLHELISYYSRSEAQPEGVDIEAPFRLPARIREIQTARGEAFVVQ